MHRKIEEYSVANEAASAHNQIKSNQMTTTKRKNGNIYVPFFDGQKLAINFVALSPIFIFHQKKKKWWNVHGLKMLSQSHRITSYGIELKRWAKRSQGNTDCITLVIATPEKHLPK